MGYFYSVVILIIDIYTISKSFMLMFNVDYRVRVFFIECVYTLVIKHFYSSVLIFVV